MNPDLIKTLVVIALRQAAPLLGGVGLMADGEIEKIAGAVILLGSIVYHAYKRTKGKKQEAAEDARKP